MAAQSSRLAGQPIGPSGNSISRLHRREKDRGSAFNPSRLRTRDSCAARRPFCTDSMHLFIYTITDRPATSTTTTTIIRSNNSRTARPRLSSAKSRTALINDNKYSFSSLSSPSLFHFQAPPCCSMCHTIYTNWVHAPASLWVAPLTVVGAGVRASLRSKHTHTHTM